MKSDKFGSQLERKSKTWFFSFLDVCFLNRTRQNSDLTAYFADQNGRKDDLMKMNFVNFQIQKWISQIVRAQKADKKNGVICLISFFLSWVMVLKLHKIVHFLQFVLTSARNLDILKQFISIHQKDLIILFQKIVFLNRGSRY